MGLNKATTYTWTCDGCGACVRGSSDRKPNTASDPWAYVKIDQDSGFDYQGHPWAPRFRDPFTICSACVQAAIDAWSQRHAARRAATEGE